MVNLHCSSTSSRTVQAVSVLRTTGAVLQDYRPALCHPYRFRPASLPEAILDSFLPVIERFCRAPVDPVPFIFLHAADVCLVYLFTLFVQTDLVDFFFHTTFSSNNHTYKDINRPTHQKTPPI